jgi:hypothetical protein
VNPIVAGLNAILTDTRSRVRNTDLVKMCALSGHMNSVPAQLWPGLWIFRESRCRVSVEFIDSEWDAAYNEARTWRTRKTYTVSKSSS